MLCSYDTWILLNEQQANSWGWMEQTTYLLTAPGVNFKTLEKKFEPFVYENLGAKIEKVGATFKIGLQPLTKIHLYSNFNDDTAKIGSIMYVYLFSGVALFILLIACINFVNLTTARYSNRALEVGLRKTLGASRISLIRQFLGETILVTFFAVIIGYLLALVLLPLLYSLTGQELNYRLLVQPWFLCALALSVLGIGVLAGSYPAIFLSAFQPVKTLKGNLKRGAASFALRRILVVGQFSISIALIVGTLIIYDQLQFIRNKQLGFNKDQVLTLPYPHNSQNWSVGSIRQELASVPGVMNVGFTSNVPGAGTDIRNFRPEGRTEEESILMEQLYVEPNLLPTLGIEIIEGRNFSESIQTDPSEAALINETTAKQLGWDDPIGKAIFIGGRGQNGKPIEFKKKIVGVVRDFHTRSLHNKIEPLTIFHNQAGFSVIAIKLAGGTISETVSKLRKKWERLFPDQLFSYSFLDESFDKMYRAEEQMNKIFTSFSLIAIIISCLGLFGLAAYMTEKRTKEVGIRKVMGASVAGILFLLSKEFTKWVLIANVIAWPTAYYFMNRWLQTFAYHIDLNVWKFILSGFMALLIAWITVSYQSIRIARSNPVKSLRYE
jgi:putative ABC transport system permease protein